MKTHALALASILLGATPAAAQWRRGPRMAQARAEHSATVLADGRVLLAGGALVRNEDYEAISTAEIYDPASRTFAPAGAMQVARRSHAAVLLRDGRVLVAGGYQPIESLDSAEIFDPATGAWARVASMHEGRSRAHGVLLDDGSVLVVGDGYEGVVEIYVPSEDVWRLGPPLDDVVRHLVRAGTGVYAIGAQVWRYAGTEWIAVSPVEAERLEAVAVPLGDAILWASGGQSDEVVPAELLQPMNQGFTLRLTPSATAVLFDLSSATWSAVERLRVPRAGAAAVTLADGRVLVTGGFQMRFPTRAEAWREAEEACEGMFVPRHSLRASELYDPRTRTFRDVRHMRVARRGHTATLLSNGCALIAGGWTQEDHVTDTTTLFCPEH